MSGVEIITSTEFARIISPRALTPREVANIPLPNIRLGVETEYLQIPDSVAKSRRELPRRCPHQVVGQVEVDHFVDSGYQLVFLGGAALERLSDGELHFGNGRARIAMELDRAGIYYFDPTVRDYDPKIHGNAERTVTKHALLDLYEIRSSTFCGTSVLEIVADMFSAQRRDIEGIPARRIVFINNVRSGDNLEFVPAKLRNQAPLIKDYKKAGNGMRESFVRLLIDGNMNAESLIIPDIDRKFAELQGLPEDKKIILISKSRMHSKEILEAFYQIMKGENIQVCFEGYGGFDLDNPKFPPFAPPSASRASMVQDYKNEGTEMRKKLLKLIGVQMPATNLQVGDESTVVVFDKEDAITQLLVWWKEIPNGMKYPL